MNNLEKKGYNTGLLKQWRRQSFQRKLLSLVPWFVVVCCCAYFLLSYIARLPRERFAKDYSFTERASLGIQKSVRAVALSLDAEQDDPKTTKLPITEIYIKGKRIDRLNSNLPDSGTQYQKANVKIAGKIHDAEVRYRGDSLNHWAFPNKSWRVQLEEGRTYQDIGVFNLNVPRTETQISNWLGYAIARRMGGMLVPHAENTHFRLNREFDGVRLLLEQVDQGFLYRRQLPAGKIYIGDITSAQIYGGQPRKRIYQDSSAWEVRGLVEDSDRQELVELLRILREEHNPYVFYSSIQSLVDMPALLRYMAMLELVGSVHVDETHNGKFYFNPQRGKFTPVVWDTVAYFWKNSKSTDLGTNSLFRKVLENPEFREQKDRVLWESIQGDLSESQILQMIQEEQERIKQDIYAFPLKLRANDKGIRHVSNGEWEKAVESLKKAVGERHQRIRSTLEKTEATYRLQYEAPHSKKFQLAVQVQSPVGITLEQILLEGKGKVTLRRRGIEDAGASQKLKNLLEATFQDQKARISPDDRLFSKRRFRTRGVAEVVPATYVYEGTISGGTVASLKSLKLIAKNSVTGKTIPVLENASLEIHSNHRPNEVWWTPEKFIESVKRDFSGKVQLTEDLVIDRHTIATIKPGTTFTLAPGVSIIIDGGTLTSSGTEKQPVRIQRTEGKEPWGSFSALNGAVVNLSHTEISGGSDSWYQYRRNPSALNIFQSRLTANKLFLDGSYIFASESDAVFQNSTVKNIYEFSHRSSKSTVQDAGLKHEKELPVHSRLLANQVGYGTNPRAEREFKYSIIDTNSNPYSLSILGKKIQKALSQAVELGDIWKSPGYAKNPMRSDEDTSSFIFRDIYFDTSGGLNAKNQVSYRLRNRYGSSSDYKLHVRYPHRSQYWPYRLEFQAKLNRKETGNGFSTVDEGRFEFRKESKPFSSENLPPSPPWDLDIYIPMFQEGMYMGRPVLPATELMKYYQEKEKSTGDLSFQPELALITKRIRMHMNIRTPWGSGPNPDQAYIISLDQSDIYIADEYLQYLKQRSLGDETVLRPDEAGTLVEIEVEFERNVSDKLDQEIARTKNSGETAQHDFLLKAREAFLIDQQQIMKVIAASLQQDGVLLEPATKSKYGQAYDLAYGAAVSVPLRSHQKNL